MSTAATFIVAALAARDPRVVTTADIGGAYLNAPIGDYLIFMKLDSLLTNILITLAPYYKNFVDEKNEVVVQLDSALYGCGPSSKLWYEDLSGTLQKIGFKINPSGACVFNMGDGDEQCTICVYVDDLLITCKNSDTIDGVIDKLVEAYEDVKVNRGKKHSYLGMTFDFSELNKVKISMEGYIADLLRYYNVTNHAATPATTHLFDIRKESELLQEDERIEFHSAVAKLLYLAKRVRPRS